mmetsp:Transcript_62511/g.137505  ORF Transcript_62511/g.137505 Transcript_62511/m.137505 type:complete len:219 (-) Transcript_62511:370-1026(-)
MVVNWWTVTPFMTFAPCITWQNPVSSPTKSTSSSRTQSWETSARMWTKTRSSMRVVPERGWPPWASLRPRGASTTEPISKTHSLPIVMWPLRAAFRCVLWPPIIANCWNWLRAPARRGPRRMARSATSHRSPRVTSSCRDADISILQQGPSWTWGPTTANSPISQPPPNVTLSFNTAPSRMHTGPSKRTFCPNRTSDPIWDAESALGCGITPTSALAP